MAEQRTVFISSCSRRELARRRPQRAVLGLQRPPLRLQLTIALMALAAVATVLALRGGL